MDGHEALSTIRFGVLGTARVAPYALLGPAQQTQGVEVDGIASRTLQKAEEFAARHRIWRAFGSYQALLESDDIDAVYVALPPALHHEWARRAIEAGKHVLCEKPLAVNARLTEELMLFAKRHDRRLVEAMHVRYFDRLRRQRELIASGECGQVLRIELYFRAPYVAMAKNDFRLSFQLGGGAALDMGCYAISCLRYMAGEEPELLSVRHKCSGPQIDRWMRAMFRFPSGIEGVAECGFRGFYTPRGGISVICESGSIKWDAKGLVYEKNGRAIHEPLPTTSSYQLQLDDFVRAIKGKKSDALGPEDALFTARIIDGMYEKAGLALRGTPQV